MMYVCVCVMMYVCVCVMMYECVCVMMYVCVCVMMYVCVCVMMYVCVCVMTILLKYHTFFSVPHPNIGIHWLHPNIGIHNILRTVLCTFTKVLTRRICLTIKHFFTWGSFPLLSWHQYVIL